MHTCTKTRTHTHTHSRAPRCPKSSSGDHMGIWGRLGVAGCHPTINPSPKPTQTHSDTHPDTLRHPHSCSQMTVQSLVDARWHLGTHECVCAHEFWCMCAHVCECVSKIPSQAPSHLPRPPASSPHPTHAPRNTHSPTHAHTHQNSCAHTHSNIQFPSGAQLRRVNFK